MRSWSVGSFRPLHPPHQRIWPCLSYVSLLRGLTSEIDLPVQRCGGIENVNVEKGDKSQHELAGICACIPVDHIESALDRIDADNRFEKVESIVPFLCVRKVRERGGAAIEVNPNHT